MIESPERHGEIGALIPWYVNGTLPREEAQAVERHAEGCADCAREIERQLGLAAQVCMLEGARGVPERSFATLRARIEAEAEAEAEAAAGAAMREAAVARRPAARRRRVRPGALFGTLRGRAGLAGGMAAAALVALLVLPPQDAARRDAGFRTLTSPDTAAAVVLFQPVPGLSAAALGRLLAARGLTLADGPSEGGVWRAEAPAGSDAAAAAEALMAAPEILFAAPGAPD